MGVFRYQITPDILPSGELQFPEIDNVEWYYPYTQDPVTNELLFDEDCRPCATGLEPGAAVERKIFRGDRR